MHQTLSFDVNNKIYSIIPNKYNTKTYFTTDLIILI